MDTFEYAVEFGFTFEYYEVRANSEREARTKLWDEAIPASMAASVTDVECVS